MDNNTVGTMPLTPGQQAPVSEKPAVSLGFAVAMILFFLIPVVGLVVSLVTVIVSRSNKAKRNLASACLIFSVLGLVIFGALTYFALGEIKKYDGYLHEYLGDYGKTTDLAKDIMHEDVDAVLKKVDLERFAEKIELEKLLKDVDLSALLKNVDLSQVAKEIDLKEVLKDVDMKELLADVDTKELLDAVDLDAVISEIDVNEYISKVDLSGLDASKVDFSKINLKNADLSVIDYSSIDWSKFSDEELKKFYDTMPSDRIK
jgi:uncharacterized protein YjbI with pentapeptide repeats